MRIAWPTLLFAAFSFLAIAPEVNAQSGHPVVLGFERFHGAGKEDVAAGGRLLLGELNCLSCHKAEPALEKLLTQKQAPILDGVGSRIRVGYLRSFLNDPHAAKPGTAMPDVLGALAPEDRKQSIEALVHYLATTGTVSDTRPSAKSIASGSKLYNQVGCAVCHGPRDAKLKVDAAVAPLGELSKKYTIIPLTAFLQDPHKVRPSGRMPGLNLTPQEAQDIAHYLLADVTVAAGRANLKYAYYELQSEPGKLPDFAKLKPTDAGDSAGFDLSHARRNGNVAMKFDGYLKLEKEGFYTFHVTSDDGAKLWVGSNVVVDNDGIHPPTHKSAGLRMPKGLSQISVAVFNGGGGYELEVEIEGPDMPRQPIAHHMQQKAQAEPKQVAKSSEPVFQLDPALARRGQELFTKLGCASCHNLKQEGKTLVSTLQAPALAKLDPAGGCLADNPTRSPRFHLSAAQRTALAHAVKHLPQPAPQPLSHKDSIGHTFTAFNCYACHVRDSKGGVEAGLDPFFKTAQQEMGDEGRVPPHLDGVGAKLTAAYMKKVLANGAADRPYMLTRMPKFGEANVGHLQPAFEALDTLEPVPPTRFSSTEKKAKSEGRFIVGNKSMGCVKCHNFREFKSGGVQGMNMAIMADRVKRDWFTRYLLDPNKFRQGTRMPAVWPLGISQMPKVLDGDTAQQIEAVWLYLKDGAKAPLPYGVGKEPLPLVAGDTAIMYRNFIEGAGTRAIGVGYPEQVNLAFDANNLRYALLWHKEFMDAARHWTDRGAGFEPPLGEGVLALPPGPDLATLATDKTAWPAKATPEEGYKFRGYRFDDKLRPTFLYDVSGGKVEDFMQPVAVKDGAHLMRTLTITGAGGDDPLYFRAASAAEIKSLGQGWYQVGSDVRIRIEAAALPELRSIGGKTELLVPLRGKQSKIIQEIVW